MSPKINKPAAAEPVSREWPIILGLSLMGLVILFYRLGVPGLMDPDEGRYAEIAREIWARRDWLVPHLNGLPYLEKPPLVYWLTALSFRALGYSEFAARLPSALSALGGIMLAYWLGRALWGRAVGFFSAIVLATCAGYVALGRILTLDMTLAFFLNLGVGLGYLALSRGRRDLWVWAYLALGLGVLTKGPVAPLLAWLIWGIWALLRRQPWRPILHPGGLAVLAALSLPWFAWITWRYPDFFQFFILEQHFGRYLTEALHPQPFYYYGPMLLALMLPWSWLLPWSLWQKRQGLDSDSLFLLIWAGAVLVFFSLSQGKLPPYILPALLPLSLLLGESLFASQVMDPSLPGDRLLKVSLILWALVGWGLALLYLWPPAWLARHLAGAEIFRPYLPLLLLGLALAPTLALVSRRLGVLFLAALLLSTLSPVALERLSTARSPRDLGRIVETHWEPGAALVGVRLYSQGLSFYSGQIFHLASFRTELDFGRRLVPKSGLFFSSPEEMRAFARSRPLVFFYLKGRDLSGLKQGLPGKFRLLANHKDCLLASYEGK